MPEIVPLSAGPIKPFSLSAPVRILARATLWLEPGDSLALASNKFLQNGSSIVPVVIDGKVTGVITGKSLSSALGDAVEFSDAVEGYQEVANTIPGYATGAEALRAFVDGSPLVVVDDEQRLIGIISPADLFPRRRPRIIPPSLGGMATPSGVFLTGGTVVAGVNRWRLAFGGIAVALIIYSSAILGGLGGLWLHKNGLQSSVAVGIEAVSFVLLASFMFWLVFGGVHGAEHQVINAIERELELTQDVVRRMSRYHPRCGVNYSVLVVMFLGLFSIRWIDSDLTRLVAAAWITFIFWRPVSRFAQLAITTRKPTDAQLEQAISAGEELLERYSKAKSTYPTPWVHMLNSGILYFLAGLAPVCLLVGALVHFLGLDLF